MHGYQFLLIKARDILDTFNDIFASVNNIITL
jgi:hypothetical protein